MSAVLIWSLVAPKLSVDNIIDDWVAGCGNIIAASIPVLVNSNAPLLGRPPNCFTEHANFTCWNLSVYNELSFFSEFKQIYNKICRKCNVMWDNVPFSRNEKTQQPIYVPLEMMSLMSTASHWANVLCCDIS